MSVIGKIGWQNEHALSAYPLTQNFPVQNFFLDASFIQFNGFIPKLISVTAGAEIKINLLTDVGLVSTVVPIDFIPGKALRISVGDRYIGKITLGSGYVKNDVIYNTPLSFCSTTVKSIPLTAGVYSIAGASGDLLFSTDQNMFFVIDGQIITWNAVGLDVSPLNITALKTLNSVAPINNNIEILASDVITITPGASEIVLDVVQVGVDTPIVPQVTYT